MGNSSDNKRIDSASRVIKSAPRAIYQAFINPDALVSWLPPKDMKGHIDLFDAREGGTYQMSLTYVEKDQSTLGKTTEDTDVVEGTFLELVPDERIVQLIEFDSNDPSFAGTMTMSWTMAGVPEGTKVTIECENVPVGIRQDDHESGMRSTLENLAVFIE